MKQDEIDRKNIELIGYQLGEGQGKIKPSGACLACEEQESKIKPIITIDRNCLSCSTQQKVILNAFKVACLQYTPTKIMFENELYEREYLID